MLSLPCLLKSAHPHYVGLLLSAPLYELNKMTSILSSGLEKAQQALAAGEHGTKDKQLSANMKEVNDKARITSDWGVKQSNTDNWLRVTSDNKTGPTLLEDPFAREKVRKRNAWLDLNTCNVLNI